MLNSCGSLAKVYNLYLLATKTCIGHWWCQDGIQSQCSSAAEKVQLHRWTWCMGGSQLVTRTTWNMDFCCQVDFGSLCD